MKVPMRGIGADQPVVVMKPRNGGRAKGCACVILYLFNDQPQGMSLSRKLGVVRFFGTKIESWVRLVIGSDGPDLTGQLDDSQVMPTEG